MKSEALSCWRCGASLAEVLLPISRFAECPACRADLHVCRLCRFYDPRMIGQCTHDRAEKVEVKDRANFCGYFRPTPRAGSAAGATADEEARRALDDLFEPAAASSGPLAEGGEGAVEESEQDKARRELEALFGLETDRDATASPADDPGSDGRGRGS